jgi:hypothetical protein
VVPPFGPPPEGFAALAPYFDVHARFDDARARAVLAPAGIRPGRVAEYFDTLVDYAERARWGRSPLSRAAAREQLQRAVA